MKTFRLDNALPVDATIPDPSLVVLIGAAGSGKSTWASTWPATQVLELDRFRTLVSDDAGCQEATDDAVFALEAVLEARLARQKMTVLDATNCEQAVRANLIAAARRHGVPTVALVVPTPASVCVERQKGRPANRRVPEPVVRAQHAAMVDAWPGLPGEGFDHVVVAESVYRLQPLLQRLSDVRRADLGWDGGEGLGNLLLVRRYFGPEILPMWRWRDGSQLAGGDRVAEIRLGADRIVLAQRNDVDGAGLPEPGVRPAETRPFDRQVGRIRHEDQ
ncbi:AAA family ATPase [Streptomyces albogriseolus]|uniref:ATP-binding protein n=1 Tax=Streptomyces TaxID=1883 RepID=UPI002A750669|nr:ATP-binding protein [Streptomyces sp. CL7]WPP33899.1 ATP-binding protein [Streptomyces sp. CL7]